MMLIKTVAIIGATLPPTPYFYPQLLTIVARSEYMCLFFCAPRTEGESNSSFVKGDL